MDTTESAHDQSRARKQAERDMRDEGFLVDTKCPHADVGYEYKFDGSGTEKCTKWCTECGRTLRRWTNNRSVKKLVKAAKMASHEETLAGLQRGLADCEQIQAGIAAQSQEIDNLVATLNASLGNTEAGSAVAGQANSAKESLNNSLAAMEQLKQVIGGTLERFQGAGG